MAQPTKYNRAFNFADQQAMTPAAPTPAPQLESEYNRIRRTTDEIIDNLGRIQRDDGEIRNETVGFDQLKPELGNFEEAAVDAKEAAEQAKAASESTGLVFETRAAAESALTVDGFGNVRNLISLAGNGSLGDNGTGAVFEKADTDLGMPAGAVIAAPGISKFFVLRQRTISAEMLNARGNGEDVDDQAFDDMADYAGQLDGKVTFELPGAYKLNEGHVFQHGDITLDFKGRGVIDASGASTAERTDILRFQGPGLNVGTTATADIAMRATTVTVASAAGLAAGDFITINSSGEYFSGIAGASGYSIRFKGEISRIRSISGNTLTLEHWARDSYDATNYTVRVRKLSMIQNIKVRNGYFRGTGNGNADNSIGAVGIWAENVLGFTMDGLEFENFADAALYSNIGWEQKAIGCRFHGRKLDDPTNLPTVSQWFTGWRVFGIHDVQLVGCSAKYVRRKADPDSSFYASLDPSIPAASVFTRDIQFIGGVSDSCETGPGGHLYDGMTVIGYVARKVKAGIQHRGKNLKVIGCDIDASIDGVVIGVGSSAVTDPTTYTEDPSCGDVEILGGRIVAGVKGIRATSSWTRFRLATRIEAPQACYFSCKRQSNFIAEPDWVGDGTMPAVHSDYLEKIEASRWHIRQGRLSGFTDGFTLEGAFNTPNDLTWDGVTFASCTGANIRFGNAGSPTWGSLISVINCKSSGTESTAISNSYGAIVSQFNNTWGTAGAQGYTIASGAITIAHNAPSTMITVDTEAAAASDDLDTINGGHFGQIILLRSTNAGRDVTVKHGTGNLILHGSADAVLSHPNDVLMLVKGLSAGWLSVAPLANNAT